MWPLELVDRRNALLREVELYPRRSSILAVCRSDLGGNVPLDRLSHRASRSATARAKITARTHKCAGADEPPKVRFALKATVGVRGATYRDGPESDICRAAKLLAT